MTNTTDLYWDVDGVSLHTYARNIETLGDTDSVPTWRGKDRTYAYRAGSTARPKVADSRTHSLKMWIQGVNDDGSVPTNMKDTFDANRRALKRLCWRPNGDLVALTKRWREGATVKSATAMARISNDMAATMAGPSFGKFVIDFFLPDPWFYGPEVSTTIAAGGTVTINNEGDDNCVAIKVDYHGQLVNPKILNTTPNPDVWMKLGASVAVGDTVTADVDATTVLRASDSANLVGAITHSGSRAWMGLLRGNNSVQLTVDSGAGNVTFRHRPAFF